MSRWCLAIDLGHVTVVGEILFATLRLYSDHIKMALLYSPNSFYDLIVNNYTSWSMLYVHVLHCYFSQAAIKAHKHERTGASVSHCWLSPSDRGGFRTEKCHWASFKGRSLSKPHSLAQAFLPSSFNQNWTAGRPGNWASYWVCSTAFCISYKKPSLP